MSWCCGLNVGWFVYSLVSLLAYVELTELSSAGASSSYGWGCCMQAFSDLVRLDGEASV